MAATKAKLTPEKPEKQTWAVNLENNEETSPDESTSNDPPVTPFESIFYDEEEAQYEEYLRYMTQFVDVVSIFQSNKKQLHKASWVSVRHL